MHGRLDQFFRNTRRDVRWFDQTLRATGRKVERQMFPRHPLIDSGQRVGLASCGKTISAQQTFDGLHAWNKGENTPAG